jgi:hypothetical protein
VKAGLATATGRRMTARGKTIDVTWMRITDEGRRALVGTETTVNGK